ncbi:MAG: hypothetical protein QOG94_506 [Solirubrobacteraceae bacterium]|nr:hypothetical protein [Solirubrobacteraceae bacterium]
MASVAPTLADPADPLGKLQRGLGSGYLWALDADRAVSAALLVHCIFNDPRWDRQLDDRDDYHATLALDVGLDLRPLEAWLRGSGEDDGETAHDVLAVLGRMAIRGHADARRVLCEYVSYGAAWARAIEGLVGDTPFGARGGSSPRGAAPWPEVVGGLDAVLLERFATQEALDEALSGIDPRERPWTLWSVENPKIARALALDQGHTAPPSRAWRPRERQPKPRELTTVELLGIEESSRWAQIAEELATRTSDDDVRMLLAAANAPDLPMRRAAILALGQQGRREVLAIAEQNTHQAQRGKLQGAIALALEAMPLSQTRALAHDWLTAQDWARRRKAAGLLASWAEEEDLAPARDALARELDRGLDGDVYVVCSLAEALGRCAVLGPFEELTRAYEQIPYSYGRRYVVAALAAADPTFAGDVAVECLWDCERETRALAAERVDRRVRLAMQRLQELSDDESQAASVRRAAANG